MMTRNFTITGPIYGHGGWRDSNPQLFPSDASFRWFHRRHQERLVRERAIVKLRDAWQATNRLHEVISQIAAELADAA